MNRLWKLAGSSSAGENEFSLLMILQVARCVRMQLYRITLSHLYRKLLVTRFHSTVSVLRPTSLTSLWLKKKEKKSNRVFGSRTQSECLAGRSVTACGRHCRCFFLAACQTTVCLAARPLLRCCCAYLAGEKGERGGGNWPELVTKSKSVQISWENVAAVPSSRFSRAPRCNPAALAVRETGDKCCCVFAREFIYCTCVYFASFRHRFCRSLNTNSHAAAGNGTGNASESDLGDCLSLSPTSPHTLLPVLNNNTWAHSCTVLAWKEKVKCCLNTSGQITLWYDLTEELSDQKIHWRDHQPDQTCVPVGFVPFVQSKLIKRSFLCSWSNNALYVLYIRTCQYHPLPSSAYGHGGGGRSSSDFGHKHLEHLSH